MRFSWYRIGRAFGQVASLSLAVLLVLAPAVMALSPPSPEVRETLAFLQAYQFNTVPLAESLAVKNPRVRQDAGALPLWKRSWDEARQLAVSGQLAEAAQLYRELLQGKEISEARWEWATILVALGRDQEAIGEVESLNDQTPNRPEYLQCLAVMNLHLGRFREAAAAFDQLHALQPDNGHALAGQVYALLAAGDTKAALPLLEALWRLTSNDLVLGSASADPGQGLGSVPADFGRGLRELLASLAYEMQEYELAWGHLLPLASGLKPTVKVLLLAARTSDRLGYPEQGVAYWQRYVEARPDDLEGRQRLADFFEKSGQRRQALPHLLVILRHRPDDLEIMKRIGQGYAAVQEFGKAAEFLEKYLDLRSRNAAQSSLVSDSVQYPLSSDGYGDSVQSPLKSAGYGDSVQSPLVSDGDKEVAALLVTIQGAMGRSAQTLQALERYFVLEPQPPEADLHRAARLYEEAGSHDEALAVYRRLLGLHPADPEILRAAADQALAAGRREEALTFWGRLAQLTPNETSVYRNMARALEDLGRQPELYETLATIHRIDPADHELSLRLVARYFADDALTLAAQVLTTMEKQGGALPAAFSYWRGMLRMRQQDYVAALPDLEAFLLGAPDNEPVQRQALVAAGRIGDVRRVRAHHQALNSVSAGDEPPGDEQTLPIDLQLLVAQAYADCRAEAEARALYQKLIDGAGVADRDSAQSPRVSDSVQSPLSSDSVQYPLVSDGYGYSAAVVTQAFAGLAESFFRENRPYEAEEAWRTGLVETKDRQFFLPRLFSLALAQGQAEEAKSWLGALRPLLAKESSRLALMESRLLMAQGEVRQARRLLRSLDSALHAQGTGVIGPEPAEMSADRLELAAQWLKTGKRELAARQCVKVLEGDAESLGAKVILEKIGNVVAPGVGGIDLAALRVDQLLALAELYQRHELPEKMNRAAQQALLLAPQSLKAGLLLADSLVAQGDFGAAQDLLAKLAADNPEEFSLQVRIVTLEAKRGDMAPLAGLLMSPQAQSRPELTLLQARLLWRQNRWDEAIALYSQFLTPRVADRLRGLSEECRTVLPEAQIDRSIWERLTRDPGPDPDNVFAEQVMAPTLTVSLLDQGESRFSLAAARLVAAYRWQAQFAMELAPRQSVVRREYTIAQKQYEALLNRYPQESLLLYDLAGVYSRLGSLGQEAAVYDQLADAGVKFPELDEAKTRNRLKQQPRAALIYGYQSDAGRRGYLDMTRDWQGLSFWESFSTQHEAEVKVERINYHASSLGGSVQSPRTLDGDSVQSPLSSDSSQYPLSSDGYGYGDSVRANRATASYSAALLSGLTVRGAGGIESQSSAHALLLNAGVIGKIGDGLMGTMTFDRDVVRDTTASLRRHLIRQDLLGGVSLDPLPRFSVGGEYLLRDYSDNNWTTGYDLWASYLLIAEPTFLRLKYLYDFKESREGAAFAGTGDDGFAVNDHPYWAPKNYWVNQVGLYFKHSLTEDALERGTPQYYTIEYALGHDVDGYAVQTAQFGLFAELNPHCLVELASELINSQAVRKQEYRLSASYRW